jgi:hypothetical protein
VIKELKFLGFFTAMFGGLGLLYWLLDIGIFFLFSPNTEHYQNFPDTMWRRLLAATLAGALFGAALGLAIRVPARARERKDLNGS